MTKLIAGEQLRADMDAALARAARDLGQPLEFSEVERHTLAWHRTTTSQPDPPSG